MRVLQIPSYQCTECLSYFNCEVQRTEKLVKYKHPDLLSKQRDCKESEREFKKSFSDFSVEV